MRPPVACLMHTSSQKAVDCCFMLRLLCGRHGQHGPCLKSLGEAQESRVIQFGLARISVGNCFTAEVFPTPLIFDIV